MRRPRQPERLRRLRPGLQARLALRRRRHRRGLRRRVRRQPNTSSGDGCAPRLRARATAATAHGLADGEQCDDGKNTSAYGGCATDCMLAPRCGDGDHAGRARRAVRRRRQRRRLRAVRAACASSDRAAATASLDADGRAVRRRHSRQHRRVRRLHALTASSPRAAATAFRRAATGEQCDDGANDGGYGVRSRPASSADAAATRTRRERRRAVRRRQRTRAPTAAAPTTAARAALRRRRAAEREGEQCDDGNASDTGGTAAASPTASARIAATAHRRDGRRAVRRRQHHEQRRRLRQRLRARPALRRRHGRHGRRAVRRRQHQQRRRLRLALPSGDRAVAKNFRPEAGLLTYTVDRQTSSPRNRHAGWRFVCGFFATSPRMALPRRVGSRPAIRRVVAT